MLRQLSKHLIRLTLQGNGLGIPRQISSTSGLLKEAEQPIIKQEENSIIVDKECNITLIGINRTHRRNAINAAAAAKLCEAFSAFEADTTSPVAVLYGVGGSFCSGIDIQAVAENDEGTVSMEMLMMPEGSVGPTRRHLQKPVVCGINGYCVANGLELALMCDLRVMEEGAILGFFNRRFGVPVIDGGTVRLPAMIGFSRALDLILTGRQVCANEAHNIGLVNRIVPNGKACDKALELAHTLAKFPQSALNHDRNSLYSSVFGAHNFTQAIQNEIMYTSKDIIDEMHEGIKWYNQTFKSDSCDIWFKREKSMADWDDQTVAEAAAKLQAEKQAKEFELIEAEKKAMEEKERLKAEKKSEAKKPGQPPKDNTEEDSKK